MRISLDGFNESVATFEAEEGVTAGLPVKITGNGKVGKCGKSDNFCGVAVNSRDGFAAVQLGGYVRLPYAESTPLKVGYQGISCADDTKIQAEESGRTVLITDIDSADKTCGMIL